MEAVEGAGLGDLDLSGEALGQVLKDNAVRGRKKGEHVLDEMLLLLLQSGPVLLVVSKIDLVDRPEAGHLILVHLPDVVVLNGQDDEAVGVLFKERLREDFLGLSSIDEADLRGGDVLGGHDLRVGAAEACVVLVEQLR